MTFSPAAAGRLRQDPGQIGTSLFISTNTVKSHLKNVYGKLGVDSRTRAVTRGLELGVITDTSGPGFTMVSATDERAA